MVHYDLLVTKTNGHYEAVMLGLPNIHVQAPTRQEVIERARKAASQLLAASELVEVALDIPTLKRTLADFGGMWKDNELFDMFIDSINSYRQELDAKNQ